MHHQVLPGLETRYILYAYCDDLKPAITNLWEFSLVERVMTLFEMSSGCMMHRTAISQKCKFLALGKWQRELTQEMIPHSFFSLSDHLDFLGVTLKSTYALTRKVNGDALQDRLRKVIGPWRGGRFMPLNLRPHSVNTYAISKLMYRCNTIDLRIGDIKVFNKVVKSFLYADLIEKPDELTLYRDIDNGGLGLVNIQTRARASLISTFLQTAINPEFSRNHYHNFLYRYFILEESLPKPDIPPNFAGDFFPTIRKMKSASISLENCDLKGLYKFLMADVLRDQVPPDQNDESDIPLTPLKCETLSPTTDWNRTWRLVRAKGLGPGLTSFMLKILWGIVPTRMRLCRILPLIHQDPSCQLCSTPESSHPESLDHALLSCPANADLPTRLLAALQKRQPGASLNSILTLDL